MPLEPEELKVADARSQPPSGVTAMVPGAAPSMFSYDAAYAARIVLRDYQRSLANALVAATTPLTVGAKLRIQLATGGGKNVVINEFLAQRAFDPPVSTLVVTKDWNLLAQQASDLARRYPSGADRIGYGSAAGARVFAGAPCSCSTQIVYATIQTWFARRDKDFGGASFELVVIDEQHWGDDAPLYDALIEQYRSQAAFIGLSATPRKGTTFQLVGESYDFAELVGRDVLAAPDVVVVNTGVEWTPRRAGRTGDVTAASLRELGMNGRRNRLIVQTYVKRAAEFGKTLVFACNISSAEALKTRLRAAGVRVDVLHSRQPDADQDLALAQFRASQLDVLVNVAMATTGLDIPDIKSVFLTRPTMSEILAAQMVGRGSRKAPGKDRFFVVDFVDAVEAHGIDFVRPAGFLGTPGRSRSRGPSLERYEYSSADIETISGEPNYEAIDGLEVQPRQTFGIEFELHGPNHDYDETATALLSALKDAGIDVADAPREQHSWVGSGKNNRVWNVEPDSTCGLEVTSRVLRGVEGFREVVDACRALAPIVERLGLKVGHPSVGTHVHLGWRLDAAALQRVMIIAAFYEPALFSLVAPSRHRNRFVRPVRTRLRWMLAFEAEDDWADGFWGHTRKHLAVNPSHLVAGGYGTLEVRYHAGTLAPAKILQWISLWMRILAAAELDVQLPGDALAPVRYRPLTVGERGDVRHMCSWLNAGLALTQRLVARRDQVVRDSWARNPTYAALADRVLAHWGPTAQPAQPEWASVAATSSGAAVQPSGVGRSR